MGKPKTEQQGPFGKKYKHRSERLRKRLCNARLKMRATQLEASHSIGRYINFLCKVETGVKTLDAIELLALARLYKIDLNELAEHVLFGEHRRKFLRQDREVAETEESTDESEI